MTTLTDDPRIHRILVELEYRHAWQAVNALMAHHERLATHLCAATLSGDTDAIRSLTQAIANVDEAERRIREAADIRREEERAVYGGQTAMERVEVRLP